MHQPDHTLSRIIRLIYLGMILLLWSTSAVWIFSWAETYFYRGKETFIRIEMFKYFLSSPEKLIYIFNSNWNNVKSSGIIGFFEFRYFNLLIGTFSYTNFDYRFRNLTFSSFFSVQVFSCEKNISRTASKCICIVMLCVHLYI